MPLKEKVPIWLVSIGGRSYGYAIIDHMAKIPFFRLKEVL
jgi:hypothetical protein